MQNRKKKKTQIYRTVFQTLWEKERVGCFKRTASKHVSRMKQITSPGWMHETSTRTWCTGKTQGERVEREVGGGIGMGNTCKLMAVSFQCMTKFTTNKKNKNKKIKIKKKLGILKTLELVFHTIKSHTYEKCTHFFKTLFYVSNSFEAKQKKTFKRLLEV